MSELARKMVTYRDDSHLTRLEAVGALSAGYRRAAIKSITLQMHFNTSEFVYLLARDTPEVCNDVVFMIQGLHVSVYHRVPTKQ